MTPNRVSHFEIKETLGAGGMGVVYKAFDTKLNRFVAIKSLAGHLAHNPEFKKRFLIEAQAAAALNHPNIATIYETLEENNDAYIVMEFIEGEELTKKISGNRLKVSEAVDYAIQIAEGLKSAHEKGIVHRDIKSQNIMVTGSNNVKIMDFGLAKLAGQSMMTQLGTTVGTINYMSPEQSRGDEIDQRTDLWALGVVFYEMLTGKLPFKAAYEQAIIYAILNEEPKPVSGIVKDVPKEIDEITKNLLAKKPDNRYQSADELLVDLKAIKQSLETGIPVEQIKSSVSTAEYINKLKQEKAAVPAFSRKRVIISTAALVLLLMVFLFKGGDILNLLGIGSLSGDKHIAVLPFTNVDKNPDNQAFVDGLMETLTNKVSQLEQFADKLWVVPASEVRASKIASAQEAYNKFGVNLVVSGSVEKLEKGYRININLVDAGNLRQLATNEIDDPMTSKSFIQDETIIKVAGMLNVELKPDNLKLLTSGKTANPQAYELYLKGRGKLLNYDKAENIIAAIGFFENAVNIDSSFALAYAGLGEAYLEKYKAGKDISSIENAIKYSNRARNINGSLISVNITLGRIYIEQGKNQEALNEFEKALLIDPKNSDAFRERAKTYMAMGKTREAELSYKEAIKMKPDYWKGYNYLGVFYFQQGKYDEAAAQFQQVISLNPNNAKGYVNLGAVYGILTRYDDAINAFNKSLQIEPDYRMYQQIATVYLKKNMYKEAARAYEKVIEMKNNDYRIWGFLADAYYKIPDERYKADSSNLKAVELALEQLKINPNNADILSRLASYYGMLKDTVKSLSTLRKVEALHPADVFIQLSIGQTYEEWLGNRKTALYWIKKAIRNGYSLPNLKTRKGLNNLMKDKDFITFIDSLNKSK